MIKNRVSGFFYGSLINMLKNNKTYGEAVMGKHFPFPSAVPKKKKK